MDEASEDEGFAWGPFCQDVGEVSQDSRFGGAGVEEELQGSACSGGVSDPDVGTVRVADELNGEDWAIVVIEVDVMGCRRGVCESGFAADKVASEAEAEQLSGR